jgi:hypothetical protein
MMISKYSTAETAIVIGGGISDSKTFFINFSPQGGNVSCADVNVAEVDPPVPYRSSRFRPLAT